MHYRRGMAKLDVIPTAVISATPSVFASQELVEPANAQVQLDVLSWTFPPIHPSSLVSPGPVDPADAHVQAAMSKTQYQLTIEEGKLWEKLTDPDEAVDQDESPTAAILTSLREKSSLMVQSYHRRNNPPTESTYQESKNILHAMGVPCIESTGPYEAEALASSLVLNGYADYVASEDTVRYSPPFPPHARPQNPTPLGRSRLRCTPPPQHHEQRQGPPAHLGLRGAVCAPPRHARLG
jgi:flap endonuclease-1